VRDLLRGRWDPSIKTSAIGPGLHLWLPAVSDIRFTIIARQPVDLTTQTITTSDGKVIAVGGNVIYRIRDAKTLLTSTWQPDNAVREIAAGAIHDVCSGRTWAELQHEKQDGSLMRRLRHELRRRLRRYGVIVITTTLTDFAPCRVLKVIQATAADAA